MVCRLLEPPSTVHWPIAWMWVENQFSNKVRSISVMSTFRKRDDQKMDRQIDRYTHICNINYKNGQRRRCVRFFVFSFAFKSCSWVSCTTPLCACMWCMIVQRLWRGRVMWFLLQLVDHIYIFWRYVCVAWCAQRSPISLNSISSSNVCLIVARCRCLIWYYFFSLRYVDFNVYARMSNKCQPDRLIKSTHDALFFNWTGRMALEYTACQPQNPIWKCLQ